MPYAKGKGIRDLKQVLGEVAVNDETIIVL